MDVSICIYIHISSNLHPSHRLQVAGPYISIIRAKGTNGFIHVAKAARIGHNILKMGSFHLFVHPQGCKITFRKTFTNHPILQAFSDFPWAKTRQHGLRTG